MTPRRRSPAAIRRPLASNVLHVFSRSTPSTSTHTRVASSSAARASQAVSGCGSPAAGDKGSPVATDRASGNPFPLGRPSTAGVGATAVACGAIQVGSESERCNGAIRAGRSSTTAATASTCGAAPTACSHAAASASSATDHLAIRSASTVPSGRNGSAVTGTTWMSAGNDGRACRANRCRSSARARVVSDTYAAITRTPEGCNTRSAATQSATAGWVSSADSSDSRRESSIPCRTKPCRTQRT